MIKILLTAYFNNTLKYFVFNIEIQSQNQRFSSLFKKEKA